MMVRWRAWLPVAVVLAAAVALWFLAPNVGRVATSGWTYLGWGLAFSLMLVASSSYRSRRDPSVLFVAAGAAAFGIEWLLYTLAAANGGGRDWLVALGVYGLLLGPLALAACLVGTVPWRDRRGRPPLRVRTVAAGVFAPLAIVSAVVAVTASRPATTQLRVIAALTAAAALIAAARSIARGGWHAWLGGGALALVVSAVGVLLLSMDNGGRPAIEGATAWLTHMPSVGLVAILVGLLDVQRADTSRMRRATDRATAVMEGRAEIASIVAHDVRGPAGTIRSVAGSLRTSYDRLGDSQRLEFVGMIEQESLRLLRVADQMSLGLKADAGTLQFSMVQRDVEGPVLQGLHDAETGQREVRIDADHDVRAPIDPRWIAEATRQAVENALKFSPDETPITVRVHTEGKEAVIEVEDEGPGVPPEVRDVVFQKFARWRPAGYEDVAGSGLGLFVIRAIAQAHGGDASITSRGNTGTILRMSLPIEPRP
jgi:signal transduction histidine kinase